jgi:hypothetical protein
MPIAERATASTRAEADILKLGQATEGQTLSFGGDSPPDRDCFDRQIKTSKQPGRELDCCVYYKTNPI